MKIKRRRQPNPLTKKSHRGFRGYPVATVAFYGPDDKKATKVAVGIVHYDGDEADPLQRWLSDQEDLRFDEQIIKEVLEFIKRQKVLTVVTVDRIIGCPHEEGVDYPEGCTCPECPFWEGRDRWTGQENDSKLIN
ncbi:MAG: hypothetical protein AABN33_13445 [Acidobacteriota bacterium]